MPFEHRYLEITYEKINEPRSYKEKSHTLVGSQYSIFQRETLSLSKLLDSVTISTLKEKKGIIIVQLKLHLIY